MNALFLFDFILNCAYLWVSLGRTLLGALEVRCSASPAYILHDSFLVATRNAGLQALLPMSDQKGSDDEDDFGHVAEVSALLHTSLHPLCVGAAAGLTIQHSRSPTAIAQWR